MTRRPTALFESWRGRYSDSPRAISERLADLRPEVRRIWVADDGVELPPDVERVRRHTPAYFARLVTADYVVSNDIISRHVLKSPRATYLQTWHGTPLKAIGHDEVDQKYQGAEAHFARMTRDVAKWDVLLSPSAEVTAILRGAFRFDGRVIESGYPRNDLLKSPGAEEVRQRVREALGIPDDTRAVLYAPTWRDDASAQDGTYRDPGSLDVERFLSRCDDRTVLLNRMHSVVGTRLASDGQGVLDVSDHPDIGELYLAADALVSDYSSAIFDFAVTSKPIVCFAYDLEHYRSQLRPFYFDYEQWVPGLIARNTDELAEAVVACTPGRTGDVDTSERYREFVERFCPHEDGHASDRVISEVFSDASSA